MPSHLLKLPKSGSAYDDPVAARFCTVLPERRPFRIQAICDTSLEYFRNVILGVRQYCFSHRNLELCDSWIPMDSLDLDGRVRAEKIDGIIAQVNDAEFEDRLLSTGVPCVNVSNCLAHQRLPLVTQDDTAVGALAAEHLKRCGCAAFGFWGQKDACYSRERLHSMRAALRQNHPQSPFFVRETALPSVVGMDRILARMGKWLQSLPKPVGIFTVLDTFGLCLLRAARSVQLRVPEDIAILSAGDDEFWVEYESVPLSSIQLPAWEIGVQAARAMDILLSGQSSPSPIALSKQTIPVKNIAVRRSSDVLFVKDEAVQRAMSFLRDHGCKPVSVADVVRASGICRSALQTRFRAILGYSVLDKIHLTRIGHVQYLLRTSDMKLTDIAEVCHFADSPRLSVFFKKNTGMTPREYRAQFRR